MSIGGTVALTAILLALLTIIGYHTTDPQGTTRVRSAIFIWGIAHATFENITGARGLTGLFRASFAVAIAGFFVLVWLAASVGEIDSRAPASARQRRWLDLSGAMDRAALAAASFDRVCLWVMAALAAYAAWRMGLFAPIRVADVPNTFSSLDHPFHIARAQTLIRSLADGHLLRWVAHHQGGYPVEFYPLGFAWFEAAIWALAAGQLSVPIVHRIAVIAVFLAPGALFLAMARRDGWPALVALTAFALHVAVPGEMWAGGYNELVLVGLAPNVSANLMVMVAMTAAGQSLAGGSVRAGAIAAIAAAAAVWCNPRSSLALVVCLGAVWIVSVACGSWRAATARLALVGAAAVLLAAPELMSLLRFGNLYYFIRYNDYRTSLDYVASSIDAVSAPAFLFALVGTVAAFRSEPRRYVTRAVAVGLILYVAVTLILSYGATNLIPQLETTRLMPIQRLLTVYLAAVGLHAVASGVAERWNVPTFNPAAISGTAVAALLIIWLGPFGLMPVWDRGLFPTERSGVPDLATFQQVVKVADQHAPAGTAILIIGDTNGEGHHQLWAPLRTDRLFFYDDWMWYWQKRHRGPYNAERVSKYEEWRFAEVLDRGYLDRNAIGAVIVEESYEWLAEESPSLRRVFGGRFGLFTVVNPTTVVTLGGSAPASIDIANERMSASGTSTGGEALIRRNWFPRWRAEVNGRPAAVAETDDGYMRVPIPAGSVTIALTYVVDGIDITARAAAAIGLIVVAVPFVAPLLVASARRRRAVPLPAA